jgi:1-acyl-sn-glycerol-3-phosphate acyltransferase
MADTYLLTGATGFLGKVVLEALLRRREELGVERVYLVIRRKGPFDASARFEREVAPSPCLSRLAPGWRDVVEVIEGALEEPDVALPPAARDRITHVVHAAAAVDFNLPLEAAARANVATALNLLELARSCGRLRRFVCVSTAYVTPHPGDGAPIEETLPPLPRPADEIYRAIVEGTADQRDLLARSGHPNTYTLTKALAEHLMVARSGGMPLAIVRPSIISASRRYPFPGWIDSVTGFAAFVVLLGMGHMRAVIGQPDAHIDLVPVDDVATQILRAARAGPRPDGRPGILHAVAGVDRSPTMLDCWDGINECFTINRVERRPTLRYLGPPGWRYALADLLHHRPLFPARARRRAGKTRSRIAQLNTVFPYFTSRSFAFRVSQPLEDGLDPRTYVRTVCRGVYRHILRRDDSQWLLAGRKHPGHGGDARWALRQPRGNLMIRAGGWLITKVLRRAVDQVTVDVPSFEEALRAAPRGSALAILPTHRSYLDFVLCTYLFFARPDLGIPLPYVAAATEFGRIPILGRLLNAVHAFYLARGPRRENKELARRVSRMIADGKTLEFFIEGTRSRSREFLTPKRGLLRCLQETGRLCTLLPVAITYDRVPEEDVFARELAGAPKPRMSLGGLFRWAVRAWRGRVALGRIHLACGAPVPLERDSDVNDVSVRVMAELKRATVATTYHLRAYLECFPVDGLDADALRSVIERRGGRVLASELPSLDHQSPLITATLRHQFAHLFEREPPADGRIDRLVAAVFGPPRTARTEDQAESVA